MAFDGPDNRDSRLSSESSRLLDLTNLVPAMPSDDSVLHSQSPYQPYSPPHVPGIVHRAASSRPAPGDATGITGRGSKGFCEVGLGITKPLGRGDWNQREPSLLDDERGGTPTDSLLSEEGAQHSADTGSVPTANMSGTGFESSQTTLLGDKETPGSFVWSSPQGSENEFTQVKGPR